jgi:DNA-binding MarR family transcriptional regulator
MNVKRRARQDGLDRVAGTATEATVSSGSERIPLLDSEGGDGCTVHEGMRKLIQLLPRVMRGMRRRPEDPVNLAGVTLGPRHGSLLALVEERPATVGTLAADLDLNLATVSGLVAELERVGFVERSADPADRRRTMVRIAPGSEDVVEAWMEGASAPIVRALQHLSPEERGTFIKAMKYLEAELNSSPGTVVT